MGHTLRYRTVPELIGRMVVIKSLEEIDEVLRKLAGKWAAPQQRRDLAGDLAELTLLKHGLIDAELEAARGALEHAETLVGMEALRECGFVPKRGEQWTPEERRDAVGMATILAEDMVEGSGVLKLMLTDGGTSEAHIDFLLEELKAVGGDFSKLKLRAEVFPMELKVDDACVTNSLHVWCARYFYL